MEKRIYLNQDDSAFMRGHPVEDMTVEGIQRVVDYYAEGAQLAGLAFCVNMQRALFESKVWETLIDGYDPALGAGQTVLQRSGEARGMAALKRNGVDQFPVWLERSRQHGIEAFLSMRMNDAHGLEGHGNFWEGHRKKGKDQDHFSWHATNFWKDNPHLRRAGYRYERSFEGTFDYGLEEVRRYHLAFIAELFERFDMDGFEMDWMRWMFMFAPGGEARGRDILSGFIADVGTLRSAAEKRWGHSILLRHRVPAEPGTCLALGFDVPAWAERGLADQIILSAFGGAANMDYPIGIWRRLLGSGVKILALAEAGVQAYPGAEAASYHFSFAAASSALERGADGIYLFNECYRECGGPKQRWLLARMLNMMGSHKTLGRLMRRHAVTSTHVRAPGTERHALLPIPLTNPCIGRESGRWAENITVRIAVGRKPPTARYVLVLGFSENVPTKALEEMPVWMNTTLLARVERPEYVDCTEEIFPQKNFPKVPKSAVQLIHFEVPPEVLQNDVNVMECEPHPVAGTLEWAEILVLPDDAEDLGGCTISEVASMENKSAGETRLFISGRTCTEFRIARETVIVDTPAASDTCLNARADVSNDVIITGIQACRR